MPLKYVPVSLFQKEAPEEKRLSVILALPFILMDAKLTGKVGEDGFLGERKKTPAELSIHKLSVLGHGGKVSVCSPGRVTSKEIKGPLMCVKPDSQSAVFEDALNK